MKIAFYINEMNYRGVANSTYLYALNNRKILKNNSYIFFNKKNKNNKKDVIKKFKNKFDTFGVLNFKEIEIYQKKYNFDYLYIQKGGEKDLLFSEKVKTVIHSMYPQKLDEVHGSNYAFISEWLSKKFSNKKIPYVPYIVETYSSKKNLKKKLNVEKKIILGCHGGESSFDLKFVKDAILSTVKTRKDIVFLFLNIKKFCSHSRIKFLKGTINEEYKRKFINSCDYMIYGRSLGESFGLACAEFAIHKKPIISYRFNRHQSHKFSCSKKKFIEYSSYSSLKKILLSVKKNIKKSKAISKYNKYNSKKVMYLFKKEFLSEKKQNKFSFIDYQRNYLSFFLIGYVYLRHKFYNHYYNLIWSKMNNLDIE